MDTKGQGYKKVLLAILLLGISLPIIQSNFALFTELKLDGYFVEKELPVFTQEDWFNQEFQNKKQEYVEENFGFRNFFVKLNNQICFSLFKYSRTQNVVIGKENYLFDETQIMSYLGVDFIGEEAIKEKVKKLKIIQDTLKKRNIDILIAIAPGKASYFPEYIPNKYNSIEKSTTNYERYISEFLENGIEFIDFNAEFIKNKNQSDYPLFSEGGVHWTNYGEILAGDSIIKRIEQLRNIELPHIKIEEIVVSKKAKRTDNDIEKGMNLLFNLHTKKLAYPSIKFVESEKTKKIKGLTVADSFYWGLYSLGFSKSVFDEGQFWYYNDQRYQPEKGLIKSALLTNVKEEIEKHQVILLLFTEANLSKFSYGFIETAYDYYVNGFTPDIEERIIQYMKNIEQNSEWVDKIKYNAIKNEVSYEVELRNNAEYMIYMEERKK